MTSKRILVVGAAYALLYVAATTFFPPPAAPATRALLASAFLFLPAAVASLMCLRAARESRGAERAFWGLLAGGALSQVVNTVAYAAYQAWLPQVQALLLLGHFGYHTYFILVVVALLVRPERPLGPGGVRAAALEWVMALVGGYFLLFYFILLPASVASYPWALVYTVQEALPAVMAGVLAWRVREEPFRGVYRLVSLGFLGAAAAGVVPNWLHRLDYRMYGPLDIYWMVAFVPLSAAAVCPRGPVWVRPLEPLARDRRRALVAAAAVAIPPFLDIFAGALGVQPHLAYARSQLALAASALLSILVALRVHEVRRPAPVVVADGASGEPSEFLQLASGAAHELNNPLMAVAGWAELAMRRGAAAEGIQELLAAVRRAAEAVTRLQRLSRSGRTPTGVKG